MCALEQFSLMIHALVKQCHARIVEWIHFCLKLKWNVCP